MNDYVLEYEDRDKARKSLDFSAVNASGAFKYAMEVAPGTWATLRDSEGEICRMERMSHDEVWIIAHPAKSLAV